MNSFIPKDLFGNPFACAPKRARKPSAKKKLYVPSPSLEKIQPEARRDEATVQRPPVIQDYPDMRALIGQIRNFGKNPDRTKRNSTQLWLPGFAEHRLTEIVLDGFRKGDSQLFQTISQLLACTERSGVETINHHPITTAHHELSKRLHRLPTQEELKLSNPIWEKMDKGQFNRKVNKLSLGFTPGTLYNIMQSLREESGISLCRVRVRLMKCKAAQSLLRKDDDMLLAECEAFGITFPPRLSIKAHCCLVKRAEKASIQDVFDELPSYVKEKLGPKLSQAIRESWENCESTA